MSMIIRDDGDDERARKERSPSYPFISLPKAIDRARAFGDAHKRSPARLAVVAETWGYAPTSSGLLQTASALKAFGLLEDLGRGAERRVQLTDIAQRILHDTRAGAKEAAIKEAALKPRLFAEYADKWLPNRPSDGHCLSELRLDRGFTEQAAKIFLRSFDETVTFANLNGDDSLSPIHEEAEGGEQNQPTKSGMSVEQFVMAAMGPLPKSRAQVVTSTSTPRATLPLPEGTVALEVPQGLSRKSYEALKSWIDVMVALAEKNIQERWYIETYGPKSTQAETAQYLPDWVTVKKFMAAAKEAAPDIIFRVIAPDGAPERDLAELRGMGAVRTF